MTTSRQKEEEISRKLALVAEFEPLLDANSRILSSFKAEKFQECGNSYQSAKDLFSSLEKSEIVQKIWTSVECSAQKVKDEIANNLKNEHYSLEEIPVLLVTLSLLGFPTDPLAFYLTNLKERFDHLLCEAFALKSSSLNSDDDTKVERRIYRLLIAENYPELKNVLETLEHSNLKEGVKVFHSLCGQVIGICKKLEADFGGSESKKIAKMVAGIPAERQRSISFLFEMFCNYFEERLDGFFQVQDNFPRSFCKVQKCIDIFTQLTDSFVFLQDRGEVLPKFSSLIQYFAGKAAKYCNSLFCTCPNYEEAEDWKMIGDYSSTRLFAVKFSLFLFLIKCICTFFSFGENQKENTQFYLSELVQKFNSISDWLVSRAGQCKEETLAVLKNSQIDLQEKKQFLAQNNELMLKCISNCYCFANNYADRLIRTCIDFEIHSQITVSASEMHLKAMESCINCYLDVNRFEICKIITEGLAIGVYDYSVSSLPTKVRNYCFHSLILLMQIYSQMSAFRAFVVQRVLLKMVELFFQHFVVQMQKIPEMDARGLGLHGILLLKAEFSFFLSVLSHWTVQECQVSIQKANDFMNLVQLSASDIEHYTQLHNEIVKNAIQNSSAMFSFPLQ